MSVEYFVINVLEGVLGPVDATARIGATVNLFGTRREFTGRRSIVDSIEVQEYCPDCRVAVGERHNDVCDLARCRHTGLPLITCEQPHDCGRDTWTGYWPGSRECAEYGWLHVYPDLDRLHREAFWDPDQQRWFKKPLRLRLVKDQSRS